MVVKVVMVLVVQDIHNMEQQVQVEVLEVAIVGHLVVLEEEAVVVVVQVEVGNFFN
jgi:hypothetical protein